VPPVLESPLGVLAVLLIIEAAVLRLSEASALRRLFSVVPPLFFIYFLPTVASGVGLVPRQSPVYTAIIDACLPACLVLLFLAVDLRAIARLGPRALAMMAVSSASIVLGGPLVLLLFGRWLPPGAWSGLGALSASWLGGSANMVAVKASIGTPEAIFSLAVIVDVVVAYAWMGLVLAGAGHQAALDRWTRADAATLDRLSGQLAREVGEPQPMRLAPLCAMLALAAGGAALASSLARLLPEVSGAITAYTWTVILVTLFGVLLSLTPARRFERQGASKLGYALLYLVLTSIGARADLSAITDAPALVLAGAVWILLHGLCLLGAARLLRAPIFLAATASQANVGGPVSAPVVAAAYRPGLAQVGLLLAVLGNVAGTYLGLVCATLCRAVAQ
jgi:uncharacterized membrane protein